MPETETESNDDHKAEKEKDGTEVMMMGWKTRE